MKLKPYEHQQKILDENPAKLLLAHGMGSGKTYTSLWLAKQNSVKPLIIVPKPVRRKWNRDAATIGVDCTIVTREEFRRDFQDLGPHDAVIVDEAHYGFPTLKAQLHKKLKWYLKTYKISYVWLLTGTPFTRDPWSIYGLAKLLGHDWNYLTYRQNFFREQYYGSRSVWVPKSGIESDIADLVQKIGDVVSLDDCFDVPEQIFVTETFTFTPEQKRANKSIKEDEPDPLVRTTKYHQVASGVRLGTEFSPDQTFKCEKNDRIIEHCMNHDKVIVVSRYNKHLEHLSDMLKKKKIPHAIVNGRVKEKEDIFDEAEKADRFVVLVNAMCSVGYELPSFGIMIFASLSYSYVDYAQMQGRILRANALKSNLYINMTTEDSLDEGVWDSIKRKQDFSEAIFSKENNI